MLNNPIPLILFTTDIHREYGPKKEHIIFAEVQWFRTPGSGAEGHKQLCYLFGTARVPWV
jgi:hypothetical protein